MKKKTARVQAEMEDLKLLLEEEQSRNAELEKKQRRYNNNCTFKLNSGLEKKSVGSQCEIFIWVQSKWSAICIVRHFLAILLLTTKCKDQMRGYGEDWNFGQ